MAWPAGNGEMAALVRTHDWRATALGASDMWPERLKAAVETTLASPLIATLAVGKKRLLLYNDAAAGLCGSRHPGALGRPLAEVFADSWQQVLGHYDRAFAGESVTVAAQPLPVGNDGSAHVFDAYLTPLRDAGGEVIAAQMTGVEIGDRVRAETALRESEARLRSLVGELQGRVRDILTVVRMVFARTAETKDDPDEAMRHFRGRLDALARTQLIVTRHAEGTADLEELILEELRTAVIGQEEQLRVEGPPVALPAEIAEPIGLAVHELTTNALKYGALKFPDARLDIRWSLNPRYERERWLRLTWSEQNVPMIAVTPLRDGFGRELIEKALPDRTRGKTRLEFRGGGICCEIALPLAAKAQV